LQEDRGEAVAQVLLGGLGDGVRVARLQRVERLAAAQDRHELWLAIRVRDLL
jgi:hypothetical protein